MLTAPTANPRWRLWPCAECGALDWMFGRKHLCADCQSERNDQNANPLPEARYQKPVHSFPADAVETMRKMRALGGTWKVIAIPFGCDWQVARNFFLSNCGKHDHRRLRLESLLEIAEQELGHRSFDRRYLRHARQTAIRTASAMTAANPATTHNQTIGALS